MHPCARRRPVLVVLLACCLLLAACSEDNDPAPAAGSAPVTGSDGVGDPYFPTDGNGGYEVDSYGLDLAYDPASDVLTGVATIAAQAAEALSGFSLDLAGLQVATITVDGAPATWDRDGDELVVTPATPLQQGAFTTVVRYSGVPEPVTDEVGTSGFLPTADGAVVAGEPHVAATWFPANDHPSDAASVDLSIAVPEGLTAVSNGELVDRTTAHGTTTWHWRAADPMATYLLTLAIGDYRLSDRDVEGIHYWDAVDNALFATGGTSSIGAVATASLQRQPEILDFLAGVFGPYPFEVAGGIVIADEDLGFALESQTRPIYAPDFFGDSASGDLVVVHELAHQWFGDSVHLAGWQHVWLNEGFATYAEWLWTENGGGETVQQQFDDLAAAPADDEIWDLAPGDPGPGADELFSPSVYLRGAMTLVALRTRIGDDDFVRLLHRWAADEAGRAVTTEDFVALAEEVSGQQLDDLFHTWLDETGKPAGLD